MNYLILLCPVISIILGSLWFGPLFGKRYRAYCGMTPEMEKAILSDPVQKASMNKMMMKSMILAFFSSLLLAFSLSGAITAGKLIYGVTGIYAALLIPFFNWLGFVVPPTLGMVLWENKKWGHWFLVSGFWLVYMCLCGLLLVFL